MKTKKIDSFEALAEQDKKVAELLIELARLTQALPLEGINISIFGLTSTGKSTLINSLLGQNVAETGVGETTTKITPYQGTQFTLWDAAGRNDETMYMTMEYISFFKGLTRRVILIQSSIKENSSMMKLLDEINLTYDIVVNKYDLVDENEQQGFKSQIQLVAGYVAAELLNVARENHGQQARENAMLREDLRIYYDRQSELTMRFIEIMTRIRCRQIKSFTDLAEQDTETKKALIELAQKADPIEMKGRNIGFLGLTSTGKSTLLNSLLGQNVAETGVGETTTKITPYQGTQFTLWDAAGRNDETMYMTMEYISFFKGLTRRVILIQSSIKENSSMMKLLDEINLTYDIVVNKYDLVDENEQQGFKSQIQREIETLGLKGVNNVFYISAKYTGMFPEWTRMVDYLTS
ncbi:unnamed protein product [Didymodactylos carnosus]|uniref:G domain-containing protein n=1 Tax=Didymodactylos carnosus TaxID=1234261 RepID=A0A814PCK8_9BILA|nr:unnamed protein product [Didymodactylos carnosus]CAF3870697.1 unnamed protein product [Didymodactylos carnosus]